MTCITTVSREMGRRFNVRLMTCLAHDFGLNPEASLIHRIHKNSLQGLQSRDEASQDPIQITQQVLATRECVVARGCQSRPNAGD